MVSTPEERANSQPDADSLASSPPNLSTGSWKFLEEKTQKKKILHAGTWAQDGVTLAWFSSSEMH